MLKVVIADSLSADAARFLENIGLSVDDCAGASAEELKPALADAAGLFVRSRTQVDEELLAAAPELRLVGRAGIGVDNIDVAAATRCGVVVMNAPLGNSITTAEHAIALMMAVARQIPVANSSTQAGKWEKSRFMGTELAGKTLGMVGCGNIGAIVADRALGLKMKIVVSDPFMSPEKAEEIGVERAEFKEMLARADIVTIHAPLNDATRGLLNADAFAGMRRGARLINCARGGIVVEEDLRDAILSGQIAGAGVDVFEEEPARKSPLFGLEEVVATPHLGAATSEAQAKVALQIAEQAAGFLLTGTVVNAVNMPAISAEDLPKLQPYLELAEKLASFSGQLTRTSIKRVGIEFHGHAAGLNTGPLVATALAALLRPQLERINAVNAIELAAQRGIEIAETRNERVSDYETLMRLSVTTERQTREVAGTLFGGNRVRLVSIKGIPIEAECAPYMLYITNRDKPGVIGDLGRLLGDAGINIATFHLGRVESGGDAIALLQVDQPVDQKLIADLEGLPNITRARGLIF